MFTLTLLLGCAPEPDVKTTLPEFIVDDLAADATEDFGSWDARVYLMRPSVVALGGGELETYAPFAVGEAYASPLTVPFDGGLDTLAEGCFDETVVPSPVLPLTDVGPTMPLTVAGYDVDLVREAWDGGVDYWWDPVAEIECGCAPGTTVAFPDAPEQPVTVPEAVVLADGFAAAWTEWQATGLFELEWVSVGGDNRVHVEVSYEDTGEWRSCLLDDDGLARLELPLGDPQSVRFVVRRVATEAVVHPTYGLTQLSVQTYTEIDPREAR